MAVWLRYPNEYLKDSTPYTSKRAAIAAFRAIATEVARCGQSIEATLHYAPDRGTLREYPEFILSLSSRGVHVEPA
jgi:hypothetical protein